MSKINEKSRLGKSELKVSRLGFGAWAIGSRGYGIVPDEKGMNALKVYIKNDGNFIDTATHYGNSEDIIGQLLQEISYPRENIIIASKTPALEPDEIREEVENSLKRLQTNYVDLYYLHAPPEDKKKMNSVLNEFLKLKNEGKIKAIGASIKGADVTEKTVKLCKQYMQTKKVDVLQVIFSIFRQKNREILDMAQEYDIGIVGRTVLESGFLTGKYKPGHRFSEDDHRHRWGEEKLNNILEYVQKLEDKVVKTPYEKLSEVAIRFALEEEGINSIIVGAKNESQTKANIKAINLPPLPEKTRSYLIDKFTGKEKEFNTKK